MILGSNKSGVGVRRDQGRRAMSTSSLIKPLSTPQSPSLPRLNLRPLDSPHPHQPSFPRYTTTPPLRSGRKRTLVLEHITHSCPAREDELCHVLDDLGLLLRRQGLEPFGKADFAWTLATRAERGERKGGWERGEGEWSRGGGRDRAASLRAEEMAGQGVRIVGEWDVPSRRRGTQVAMQPTPRAAYSRDRSRSRSSHQGVRIGVGELDD